MEHSTFMNSADSVALCIRWPSSKMQKPTPLSSILLSFLRLWQATTSSRHCSGLRDLTQSCLGVAGDAFLFEHSYQVALLRCEGWLWGPTALHRTGGKMWVECHVGKWVKAQKDTVSGAGIGSRKIWKGKWRRVKKWTSGYAASQPELFLFIHINKCA